MPRPYNGIIAAATASVMLAGCGGGGGSNAPVATNQVDLPPSYLFSPADITVKTGTTVTWTNHDNFTHNVVLLELGNKNLGDMHPGGEKDTYTFDKPGVYHFRCTYHPQNMNGTVTVTSG